VESSIVTVRMLRCVLQYTILLFAILTVEIVAVTSLALLQDKVNSSRVFNNNLLDRLSTSVSDMLISKNIG